MRRVFIGLSFLALLSLFGTVFYYTSLVHVPTLLISAAVAAILSFFLARTYHTPPLQPSTHPSQKSRAAYLRIILALIGTGSLASFLALEVTHPITEATRSLWLLFSPTHITLLGIAFLCTLGLSFLSEKLSALLGAFLTFCTTSIAAILFPIGFGFDPFLHRATLAHIIEFGTITPKPLYYIGAYILELFGTLILHLPLLSLDIFLAPISFALIVWIALREKVIHPYAIAILPFFAFISTTPQAVGFFWIGILVLALSLRVPQIYLVIFALAALAAHPIAGIPALLLVIIRHFSHKKKNVLLFLTTFFGIFVLPLVFLAQQLITQSNVGFSLNAFFQFSRIPSLGFLSLHGKPLLDTTMLLGGNIFFFVMLLAGIGFIARFKERAGEHEHYATALTFILGATIAIGNFFILSLGFDFPFLINYERTDFALRLITVAWIFLLPLASYGIHTLLKLKPRKQLTHYAYGFLLVALVFTANVYVSYPRHDGYTRSAAFNMTSDDQEIVEHIANDAGSTPYVVLSNQTLASAAIQKFGFFSYFKGDIFAYPVPTSGPLYALFLEMIEGTPNKETIEKAKELTGASQVYFAVHSYWWEADERITQTKKIADAYFTSAHGTITVFVFE